MLILKSSADQIDVQLEPDDGRFWLLLRDLGIAPDGTTAIIVTIYREGLTDDYCIENFDREREGHEPLADQPDFFSTHDGREG